MPLDLYYNPAFWLGCLEVREAHDLNNGEVIRAIKEIYDYVVDPYNDNKNLQTLPAYHRWLGCLGRTEDEETPIPYPQRTRSLREEVANLPRMGARGERKS